MKSILLKTLLFHLIIFVSANAIAQDFEFGSLSQEEIDSKFYSKDPAASAVVLNVFGNLTYSTSPVHLLHQMHTKIKIFKPDSYKYGDIKIPLTVWDSGEEETIVKFNAVVYSPDILGNMVKTECGIDAARYVNENKNTKIFLCALPNVKNGSIIEYFYEIDTPYLGDFTPWLFQVKIPTIHSEYQVHFPKGQNYRVALKGSKVLSKNLLVKPPYCGDHDASWNCSKVIYAMDSIPAFVSEDRMVSLINYIPALYFSEVYYGNYKSKGSTIYISTWSDIEKTIRQDDLFGKQLKELKLFKQLLSSQIALIPDTLQKAQLIYKYVSQNIKWNGILSAYSRTGLQKAYKAHIGTSGDINLSLITAFKAFDINAEPVLLSTKRNGSVSKDYATLKGMDYVAAKVKINRRTYLVDATDALLPFGMLPEYCLNDQGRVIPDRDSSYWIDLKPAYKKIMAYVANLTLNADGSLKGEIKNYTYGYDAYYKRKEIKKFNSVNEYLENFGATFNKIKVLKSYVENVDSLQLPICETYEIEIPKSNYNIDNQILFNPYILNRISNNPFNLSERIYPIDCGPPSEQRFILTLEIPDSFKVTKIPDSVSFALPNKGGLFYTSYEQNSNKLTISHIVQLNKSIYSAEEYLYLKELYNKIIQIQKADIILNKKP